MKQRIVYIIGLLCFLQADSLLAQKLSVETTIDTNIITLGDQIGLRYNIEKEKNLTTILPFFADTLVKGIEIIGEPLIDSSFIHDNFISINIKLTITSFDTGIYYIPPQPVIFTDNGHTDTLMARPAYLMVVGVPVDTTYTIRDIKGIEKMPLTFTEIFLYVLLLLFLAAVAYFIYYYLKRKREEKPIFRALKPEEPAYITAFRELDKIKAQKLWQQKQIKEYYTRITYIIRWYIEKRFSIPALEQTSEEILNDIRKISIDDINYTNLESLLNLADLVKFAKGEPDPGENIIHLDNAYDFIKKTKDEPDEAGLTNENNM